MIPLLRIIAKKRKEDWYLVGGAVRDRLLGKRITDWDVSCPNPSRAAKALAKELGQTAFPLDKKRNIWRTTLTKGQVDFTPLGKGILQDLSRRDFTVNAMALPLSAISRQLKAESRKHPSSGYYTEPKADSFIDPFGGLNDLKRKILKAVSEKNLRSDPVRLLRAVRFSATLGLRLTPELKRIIRRQAKNMHRVSPERIREELIKILAAPKSVPALRTLADLGLLREILPEVSALYGKARPFYKNREGLLGHTFSAVERLERIMENTNKLFPDLGCAMREHLQNPAGELPRTALLKWAELFHDIGKPKTQRRVDGRVRFFGHDVQGARMAQASARKLRVSREAERALSLLVHHHMRLGNLSEGGLLTQKAIFRFFRDLGELGVDMILVSLADHYSYFSRKKFGSNTAHLKFARRMLKAYFHKRPAALPRRLITGDDLISLGMKEGPKIGKMLLEIQEAQAEGGIRTRREALIFAKKELAKTTSE